MRPFVAVLAVLLVLPATFHAQAAAKPSTSPGAKAKPAPPMEASAEVDPAPVPLPVLDVPKPEMVEAPPRVIEAVSPAEAAPPEAPAVAAATPKAEEDEPLGIMFGAKAALLIPAGRTTGVQANAAQLGQAIEASHAATVSFALAVGYAFPFLERALSVRGEAGIYPLSGDGSREYPNDPDFTRIDYSYSARGIPLTLGLGYRLPLPLPVELVPNAGFAAVHTTSTATWTRDGVSTEVAPQAGWAFGFYLGAEVAWRLGPGSLTGELRYMNARTDLGFGDVAEYGGAFNRELGDVQGTNVLVGYRFDL